MSRYVKKNSKPSSKDKWTPSGSPSKLNVYIVKFDLAYLKNTKARRERLKDKPDVVTKREVVYAYDEDVATFKLESLYSDVGEIRDIQFVERKSITDHIRPILPY